MRHIEQSLNGPLRSQANESRSEGARTQRSLAFAPAIVGEKHDVAACLNYTKTLKTICFHITYYNNL